MLMSSISKSRSFWVIMCGVFWIMRKVGRLERVGRGEMVYSRHPQQVENVLLV